MKIIQPTFILQSISEGMSLEDAIAVRKEEQQEVDERRQIILTGFYMKQGKTALKANEQAKEDLKVTADE